MISCHHLLQIWTEVQSGLGAVNFLTGAGGFLQVIVIVRNMMVRIEEVDLYAE